jgi:hypothetical protein
MAEAQGQFVNEWEEKRLPSEAFTIGLRKTQLDEKT